MKNWTSDISNGIEALFTKLDSIYTNDANITVETDAGAGPFCLDRSAHTTFDSGWYEAELFPPVGRWMSECARVRFSSPSLSKIRLNLKTHMPDLENRPPSE